MGNFQKGITNYLSGSELYFIVDGFMDDDESVRDSGKIAEIKLGLEITATITLCFASDDLSCMLL